MELSCISWDQTLDINQINGAPVTNSKLVVSFVVQYMYEHRLDISSLSININPSREHLHTKVTPTLHLTYSKNGGNLGLVLNDKNC